MPITQETKARINKMTSNQEASIQQITEKKKSPTEWERIVAKSLEGIETSKIQYKISNAIRKCICDINTLIKYINIHIYTLPITMKKNVPFHQPPGQQIQLSLKFSQIGWLSTKQQQKQMLVRMWRKRNHCCWECKLVQLLLQQCASSSKKPKNRTTI